MRRAWFMLWLVLALPALACSLVTGRAPADQDEPTAAPTKFARAVLLATPPLTAEPRPSPPTSNPIVGGTLARTPTNAPTPNPASNPIPSPARSATTPASNPVAGACPPVLPVISRRTGLLKSVILGTQSSPNAPIVTTNLLPTNATIHAVVTLQNAPSKTRVKAAWYANDIGKPGQCNQLIDSAELATNNAGAATIDFTLDPPNPAGIYRVEIYSNGTLDFVAPFSIK